jgi:hypothetical protein
MKLCYTEQGNIQFQITGKEVIEAMTDSEENRINVSISLDEISNDDIFETYGSKHIRNIKTGEIYLCWGGGK